MAELGREAPEVVGTDVAEDAIEVCRERLSSLSWLSA